MGYIFALIPPFLDSVINFLDKFILSKYKISSTVLAVYSGIFAFITGLIVILFTGFFPTNLLTTIVLIASGFFGLFILVTYFKALMFDEASRVASLFQFVPVFVLVLSFLFLHEALMLKQYIGCGVIIIAGFLFSARKGNYSWIKVNKAFWYMILASMLSAFVYVLFKIGVTQIGFWQAIPYEGFGNLLGAVCVILYGNNRKKLRLETKEISKKIFVYLSISESVYRLSRLSFYFALLLIPASIVSVLQGFQPLFLLIEGIILSVWFPKVLKEVVNKKTVKIKLFAVAGVFLGLYLIFV